MNYFAHERYVRVNSGNTLRTLRFSLRSLRLKKSDEGIMKFGDEDFVSSSLSDSYRTRTSPYLH